MTSHLPTRLSPDDARRIRILFACALDPVAAADEAGVPLDDFLNWCDQPHIERHIDNILRLEDMAARRRGGEALAQILDSSSDPIEQRRAAQSILAPARARGAQPDTRRVPAPPPRSPRPTRIPPIPAASTPPAPPPNL